MSTDDQSLSQKLARLASDEEVRADGSRVIATAPDILPALLIEIDDTVLTAALTFAAGDQSLTVIAGSRRLLDIEAASEGLGVDGDLLGTALTPEDDQALGKICEIFERLAQEEGEATVTTAPAERPGTEADGGFSVQHLSEALGLSAPDLEGDTALEKFINGTSETVIASLVLDDGVVVTTTGDEAQITALNGVLEDQLVEFDKARFDVAHAHFDPSLTFLANVLGDDLGVAVAIEENAMAVFAFKTANLAEMHKLWRLIH